MGIQCPRSWKREKRKRASLAMSLSSNEAYLSAHRSIAWSVRKVCTSLAIGLSLSHLRQWQLLHSGLINPLTSHRCKRKKRQPYPFSFKLSRTIGGLGIVCLAPDPSNRQQLSMINPLPFSNNALLLSQPSLDVSPDTGRVDPPPTPQLASARPSTAIFFKPQNSTGHGETG